MKRPSILSFVLAMLLGTIALVAMAQTSDVRAPYWPHLLTTKPPTPPLLDEWYSDVPWHQKTGTYTMNQIDVPLIFPYEALAPELISKEPGKEGWCTLHNLSDEDCMIEAGVANILVYHRTDSLYDHTDPHFKGTDCAIPSKCAEVRLDVSRQRIGVKGGQVLLVPEVYGSQFIITDASTYGPQMPWELAHFCDSKWQGDLQDPVCYADYLSPFNDGFNNSIPDPNAEQPPPPLPPVTYKVRDWPKGAPWSAWPTADSANNPDNPGNPHCEPGRNQCTFVLAGFGMQRVQAKADDPSLGVPKGLVYATYNNFLLEWFSDALSAFPTELGAPEINTHFPWNGKAVTWDGFIYPKAVTNPYLGTFAPVRTGYARATGCDTGKTGFTPAGAACNNTDIYQPNGFAYPLHCSPEDLTTAARGGLDSLATIDKLRGCGLNFEIHANGWLTQWPAEFQATVTGAPFNYGGNEYGRTVFVLSGIPGMQMPVSFMTPAGQPQTLSIYEQVHNASIFSLFLPIPNLADQARAMFGRNYLNKTFYHTLLMSNHMESDPDPFADGIRGKVLWHNEYRMQPMYDANALNNLGLKWLEYRTFQASFDPLKSKYDSAKAPAPFHNNTCDGCHVRNGSGVPIDPNKKLVLASVTSYMSDGEYNEYGASGKDYTFTGVIRPMKLVFFDLDPGDARPKTSKYSQPLNASATALTALPRTVAADSVYYHTKVMNFYGDSFHVSPKEMGAPDFSYTWTYTPAADSRVVVKAERRMQETDGTKVLVPQQILLQDFTTPTEEAKCRFNQPVANKPWPTKCDDIGSNAITAAVTAGAGGKAAVGYMHLNGKRLGNLGAIEAVPDREIANWQAAQKVKLGKSAGEIQWSPGTRDGTLWKKCEIAGPTDCVVGRFGWLGDRGTLEDQVANAAFVEMNMTTSQGYDRYYGGQKVANPLRYKYANCGPADLACTQTKGNSDLSERDVERMADYGRWLGIPTRSEIQVSQPEVVAGEALFIKLQCDTCHVIKRIDITQADVDNSPLSNKFRERLRRHATSTHKPFLSYIGTDLLMHDMGYLSQVGDAKQTIRDADGYVLPGYETFVQKVRTPALKGLRFNNYVTDAYWNTRSRGIDGQKTGDPGCDFLLHDGRACNAIEAAFLHDGPAIRQLKMIEELSKLDKTAIMQLRAFLYSL